ncbi:MAG: amino acid adenylation domain-containing protein [Sphingomonadaceae bacterium]|nr:amino acid adenylation domain-containing protein [Sphingomonadaceae bacterium]
MDMSAAPALSDAKRELLARMLRGDGGAEKAQAPDRVQPRPAGLPVPLSADQRQVWLHAAMAPDVPLYNESITIHRLGYYDHDVMERAVAEVLRRHEAWRTTIDASGAEPVQAIHPAERLAIPLSDVSHLPEADRDAAALALGSADAREAIDFTRGPLFRARVVRMSAEEHRLYLTLHHIIFDGVSIYRVIVPELAATYAAYEKGEPSPLPEPTLHYGDYAVWQREHLKSPAMQRQLGYWRTALADAPAKLELPGDRAKPSVPTHAGSMETFLIPLELFEELRALSQRHGVTLYMTLLAAFTAMLNRYTGEEDILVGGVTDLRRRPELERVVGYFLNTMTLRTRPSSALRFSEHLNGVRDSVLGALGASEVPFDEVVRDLGIKRTPGAHPLFNILFSIEPPVDPFPAGWDLTQMDVVVGGAKFDLYLELDERPEGMIGRFLYSTELFDPMTIRRMIGHWLTMLEAIADDPERTIADLPMLTAPERDAQLGGWQVTARPLPPTTLPQAIADQAELAPDAVAIVSGELRWSYAELDAEAVRIAALLRGRGISKGDLVALYLERSPTMVAALVGILRTGAAYLPLDPGFPAARLDQIVEDAAPAALLSDPVLAATLPGWPMPLIDVHADADPAGGGIAAITDDDLAYVLYTSGSTGKPKGVEINHASLANLLLAMCDEPGFGRDDSLLAVTTLSFDIAALEIFLPLVCGGRLLLASRDEARDPERLRALIETLQPSVMQATPATWRALIEAGWRGTRDLKILCGGESLSRGLADELLTRCGQLWNMYGPTETTIWSTVARIMPGETVPIGHPIANTVTFVLDAAGNLVPAGVVGELHIGGTGLARGYRGRPDLTAERFVERRGVPGVRLYRTGDLARFAPDGTLYCLGRTDAEEKIRGFRVAVEEIEGALARHPNVAAAAVRSWPDASGEKALVGYVVPAGDTPTAAALRDHLAALLPDYMIPSRFETLAALPMTPNRKIDRKALPAPEGSMAARDTAPPHGDAEERLAAIWREVLGIETIGREDSFFELGGHSLLVAKLLRRVEQDWGRRMGMAEFFRGHRLHEMAARLTADEPSVEARDPFALVPIQPQGTQSPLIWLDAGPAFLPLAQGLGPDQPFLGLPVDPIIAREYGKQLSFEQFAGHVVASLRAQRPHGPYYIGGWCTSGILAFAVASRLVADGEEVPLLVLAHAMNPRALKSIGPWRLRLSKLRFHLRKWLKARDGRGTYLRDRLHALAEDAGVARARTAEGTHGALRADLDRAAYAYRPRIYRGDVALFQPKERPDVLDSRDGWASVVRGWFSPHEIAGGHSTMLEEPHVADMVRHMRLLLDDSRLRREAERRADAA